MSNNSNSTSVICPPPFLSVKDNSKNGGYISGRFCGTDATNSGQICCLPCPLEKWIYSDRFLTEVKIARWVSVVSLVLCSFLLISFVVLPPEKSSRHYLTVGLTLGITTFTLAFIIPLGTNPDMCYDTITPDGQDSDMSCAWTGALVLMGATASTFWILLRSLWLNIRICWDKKLGRKFMIGTVIAGVGIPAALTAAALTVTGVSYRIGTTCLPNHEKSITTFWAWMVAFSGLAFVIQATTTLYCIWVYIRVLFRGSKKNPSSGEVVGPFSQERPKPHQTWNKIQRVLLMQWRSIALSAIITIEVLYYVMVFWAQDLKLGEISSAANSLGQAKTWTACLVLSRGNKESCLKYTNNITVSKNMALGSLFLGALIGVQNFFLLVRPSIFSGWYHLLSFPFHTLSTRFRRRGSDVPLTSLALEPAQDTSSKPTIFSSSRSFRSRSRSTLDVHDNIDADIPVPTVHNPYKLFLPSERASIAEAEEARRRVRASGRTDSDILKDPVFKDSCSGSTGTGSGFGSGGEDENYRPETPPPPPLPLQPRPVAAVSPSLSPSSLPASLTVGGVANPHRLPSWARAEEGAGTLTRTLTAKERDAMRGGLAMNPVGREEGGSVEEGNDDEDEGRGKRVSRRVGLKEFLREGGEGVGGGEKEKGS